MPTSSKQPETLAAAGMDVVRMPLGTDCACHRHREFVPLESHHVWPLGMGGPDAPANRVRVCANAHYLIHEFIRQLMIHAGQVPSDLARHFGPKVRELAMTGWTAAGKPTQGGGSE